MNRPIRSHHQQLAHHSHYIRIPTIYNIRIPLMSHVVSQIVLPSAM
jgi:hypothetical protein